MRPAATYSHGCDGLFSAAGRANADLEVLAGEQVRDPGSDRRAVPRHDLLVAPLATFRNWNHNGRVSVKTAVIGWDNGRLPGAGFRVTLQRVDDAVPGGG